MTEATKFEIFISTIGGWLRAAYTWCKEEPAALMGAIQSVVYLLVALDLFDLTPERAALAVAAISAAGALIVAVQVRPFTPTAMTGFFGAVVALAAGYGVHVDVEVIAAVNTVLVAVSTLMIRESSEPNVKAKARLSA